MTEVRELAREERAGARNCSRSVSDELNFRVVVGGADGKEETSALPGRFCGDPKASNTFETFWGDPG